MEDYMIYGIPAILFIVCCIFVDVYSTKRSIRELQQSISDLKFSIERLQKEVDSANDKLNDIKYK